MPKNLEYTLVSGELHYPGETTQIAFALISEEGGLFLVEAFVPDAGFFKWGGNEEIPVFGMHGKTEKGYDIEVTDLYLSSYTPHHNNKIELVSHGHLKLTKPEDSELNPEERTDAHRPRVWYVEIEGLRIKHADHTRLHQERYTPHENHFRPARFDHTACAMMLNQFPDNGNAFSFTISGGTDESPALLDFTHVTNSTLFWKDYVAVRNNLVHFLSLLNGARLAIRREYTGDSYRPSESKRWSQVMYVHSFPRLVNATSSDFLPINDHHSYTRRVFQRATFNCLDEYCRLEKELDLNSIVDALHESLNATGIVEKFSILVTMFEKLASRLALRNAPPQALFDNELFAGMRDELVAVALKQKEAMNSSNPAACETLVSRIKNLNNAPRSTQDRMHALLSYAQIPISKEVRLFLDTERHESVHQGVVGKDERDGYWIYLKLDNMMRDMLLNILGYDGIRRRRTEYFSDNERLHKEETR